MHHKARYGLGFQSNMRQRRKQWKKAKKELIEWASHLQWHQAEAWHSTSDTKVLENHSINYIAQNVQKEVQFGTSPVHISE